MIIKGKKFTYRVENKRLPNGRTTRLELIEHPGAILILPEISKDRCIMLRQYRAVFGEFIYELPAGTLNLKESLITCCRRELAEETGYSAKKFIKLGKIYPVPGYSTEIIWIYKATQLFKQSAQMDDDEILKPIVMTKKEVQRLFYSGKLIDAKSICGLAYAGWI